MYGPVCFIHLPNVCFDIVDRHFSMNIYANMIQKKKEKKGSSDIILLYAYRTRSGFWSLEKRAEIDFHGIFIWPKKKIRKKSRSSTQETKKKKLLG